MNGSARRLAVALCLAWAASGWAADTLSIRLVKASQGGADNPAGIEDVAATLKGSVPFPNFALLEQTAVTLGGQQTAQVGGYTIRCAGKAQDLLIVVTAKSGELLNTKVSLAPGRPFIVGGMPTRNGKHVLVFVLR